MRPADTGELRLKWSDDDGKTFRTNLVQRIHGDYHAMWIDPHDSNHMIAGSDGGMRGPYSVADTYFTLDKRTWLPTRYEYREHRSNSKAPAWVAETLQAQYDLRLPDSAAALRLPPGVVMVDTLSAPTDPSIPTDNVQRAHGLTVQVKALAMNV